MNRAALLLAAGLTSATCGGGPASGPAVPAPPGTAGNVSGTLTATVEGGPVAGASLSASGTTVRTAADGSFALNLPEGEHRLVISGPGLVERVTGIRAPSTGLALDVIREDGPWTLEFYREVARNGAGGGDLEPLRRWNEEPVFFIDTRPEAATGDAIPEAIVAFVRDAIGETVRLLTGNRLQGDQVFATGNPPPDMTPGTVILRWSADEVSEFAPGADAFAYRVGGPANVVVFRHLEETWAVHHEIGHVLGLYHPLGGYRPSHMWYSGVLEPPHFTTWDIFHAQVLYARPEGNTDVDVDPMGFVAGAPSGAARPPSRTSPVTGFSR